MTRSQYKRKILEQRFYGVIVILLCIATILLVRTGTNFEDRDCTVVLLALPIGIYALFTRKVVIV